MLSCATKREHRVQLVAVTYPLAPWQEAELKRIHDEDTGPPDMVLSPIGEDGYLDCESIVARLPKVYQDRWNDPKLPAMEMNIPDDVWDKAKREAVWEQRHAIWPGIAESKLFR